VSVIIDLVLEIRIMTPFERARASVTAAVLAAFAADGDLAHWLTDTNSDRPSREGQAVLVRLLGNLNTGWLPQLLSTRDSGEAQGIVGEALVVVVRAHDGAAPTRQDFAYKLADQIVNQGVRRINRSTQRMDPATPEMIEALPQAITEPTELSISPQERARYRELLLAVLRENTRKNEVATPEIVLAVYDIWEEAMEYVRETLGDARAKPTSQPVKQLIADRLKLPVTTVDTAIKRYKNAVHRQMKRDP